MAEKVWIGASSNDVNTAGNWSPSGVPSNGDNVIFDGRAVNSAAASLGALSAVTLTSIRVSSDFVLEIGAVSSGALTRLQVGATTVVIGEPAGDGSIGPGSSLIAFDFGAVTNTTRVLNAPQIGTSGFAPVMLKGTATANKLVATSGWIAYGTNALNEAYTLQSCDIIGEAANVELGGGGTLTTINQTAGRVLFRNNLTTLDQQGGIAVTEGTGTITTANIGGAMTSNSSGTITTANVINNGVLDLSGSTVSRTITNVIVRGTGRVIMPLTDYNVITMTNGVDLLSGARSQQIENWTEVTLTASAP